MRRIARVATEIFRLTFARESLGDERRSATSARRAPGRFLRLLFAAETLPIDPPAPLRRRAGSLHGLFAPESLPQDPVPPPSREAPSMLRALFAPEPLPHDPVTTAPRRASRLARLFAPERLDDDPQ